MRRPTFARWIRVHVLDVSNAQSFNLRKLAAQAQQDAPAELGAALLLYAHENKCLGRLLSLIHDDALRREYETVEKHLGQRSIERLALRGTPMNSLPGAYRDLLADYERAYHVPELVAEEKRSLRDRAHAGILNSGTSPAELARVLNVDPGNLNAFLTRGETHRLTLETARRLAEIAA